MGFPGTPLLYQSLMMNGEGSSHDLKSMRQAKITFPGDFHHALNRYYDGIDIFYGNKNKKEVDDES